MTKSLIAVILAASTLCAGAASAQPYGSGDHREGVNGRGCYSGERSNDCSQRRNVERQNHHQYVYRDGRYEDRDSSGSAAAAGVLGFVLGTAIAGQASDRDYYVSHRSDRDWRSRCATSYHDFDRRTGTYVGPDGYRHYCTQ